jgi:DNA-binding NarL/FixJ family response regulator
MRILIADRSTLICERLAAMFTMRNTADVVVAVYNVGLIFESIKRFSPDVLLLDSDMLGSGGMDLIRNLKRNHILPILIVLTNHSISKYHRRYLDAGADFHFDKAYEFTKIPDIVNRMKMRQAE